MNLAAFFTYVRTNIFNGPMSEEAVSAIKAVLSAWDKYGDGDTRKLAYILGTGFHEGDRYKAAEEYASGAAYEGRKDLGNVQRGDGIKFKGRGKVVMITGRRNYTDWARRLGIDIVKEPKLAAREDIASRIGVQGMMLGTFTGKKISDYITPTKADYVGARRVVNGTDKAALIAGYAKKFQTALALAASTDGVVPASVVPPAAPPVAPVVATAKPAVNGAGIVAIFTGIGAALYSFWDWIF